MPTVQRCDVEKGPDEEETTHRQGPHDEQLEPRAAEPDKGSGGGAAVSSRAGYVGTRRTIQCTSRTAPIHPHVIQRVVRAVERVRREATARPTSGRRGCGRQPDTRECSYHAGILPHAGLLLASGRLSSSVR